MTLEGVMLPVTTPFAGDAPAPSWLADNIARYEEHGVTGYLVLGSTGEAPLLEETEKSALLRAARAAIPASRTLLAGVGLESTTATIRLAKLAADAGADAVLVLNPHYFKGNMTAEALARHFTAVADASPAPVLLYNMPSYTGVVIPPSVVGTLASHPNVLGLKDSSGDPAWLRDVLVRVPESWRVICGSAPAFLPSLRAGAVGGILAIADAFPEPAVRLFRYHAEGRAQEALELQKDLDAITRLVLQNHGVAGIKAAMDLRGLAGGLPRPPLLPLDEAERASIEAEIERMVARELLERREV